ncbi:putative transmembrane protein [Mycobacterium tuberculosis]|nr:putative transmembrane protein [Mycobacterium tuberculosis]
MSNIIDATQRVFDETIGGDAHTWLRDHGVSLDTPPPSRPLTADDLTSPTAGSPPEAAAFGSGQPAPGATTPDSGALTAPAATALGSGQSAPGLSLPRSNAPMLSLATPAFGSSQPMPGPPPPCTVSPPLPPSAPAVGVGGPSVPAAGMPPAAAAATAPLSPQSLGQSFTTGMTTGTPAAAGYWRGEQRLATIAHQCEVKSDQSEQVADTVNYLRDRLTEIAQSGNQQINQILAGKGPIEAKVAAVNAVIEQSNAMADHVGATAMSNIIDATQRVFDETIGGDAHTWLRDHSVSLDAPARPRPVTAEDMTSMTANSPAGSPFGAAPSAPSHSTTTSGPPTAPTPTSPFGTAPMPPGPPPPGTVSPPLPPSAPAVGVGGPSVPAAGMPPAAAAATAPLSPQSLGQSFTTGMTTGTPAAAGAQALSAGALHAATEPLPPPAPPPTTPTVTTPTVATATTAGIPHIPDSAPTPSPAPIAPPTTDNASAMTPIAPMVANGPPASPAPPAAAPAGPLPAYGADLRPPVTTPPATPPTPTGPISGAAVTPSSPAAGGSLMSPVVNKSTAPATTQAQPSNPTPPLASATAAATTGAAAGDTSRRAAEQQRLRRILDTVARQEPGLSWAAGLRDNGQTTLLVTDLASGWIPPHIRLPAHITLLEPAPRRRHATVTDLLGTTTVAAAHHPPRLPQPTRPRHTRTHRRPHSTHRTHNRRTRTHPGRNGTPPRHTAPHRPSRSSAPTRNYGVPDNETDLLHHKTTEIHQAVLTTYPNHDIATVVDWMLLAAINALIAGDQSGANYHLAWAIAAISTRRSR